MNAPARERLSTLGRRLADSPLAASLRREEPLAPFTTYRLGGAARLWVMADGADHLSALAEAVAAEASEAGREPLPLLIVGRGSNLLVADRGFDGAAVMLGPGLARFHLGAPAERTSGSGSPGGNGSAGAEGRGAACVTAGGATLMPVLARACAASGLRGFEWAVGVPGTLGGGVRMNAGGHGSDMAAVLVDATIVDLHRAATSVRTAASLDLGYRSSNLAAHQAVASARLRLEPGRAGTARSELAGIVRWRRANQPGGRNCGSVFANPPGDSAGRLIEAAGAKGLRVGTAAVSAKHANFIQADEGGLAGDVFSLMVEVRRRVLEAHGVGLRVETRLAGFTASETAKLP